MRLLIKKRKEKVDQSDYRKELSKIEMMCSVVSDEDDEMMEVKMIGMMMKDENLACR